MKAILVSVNLNNQSDFNEKNEELISLCEACDIEVMDTLIQNLRNPNKKTYINSGKVDELKIKIDSSEADCTIFNDELSPTQLRNLENALGCEVIDKTYLILKIFEKRAVSKEARLQVEIAKLNYLKPRLIGTYSALDKQKGGSKNKGKGEQAKELDTRNIDYRINSLKRALSEVEKIRETQRIKRNKSNIKTVALVGYTNAGKSSIMNSLMINDNKKVYEKDQLFATLTTSTRLITLDNKHQFILSDTVGFVSDLPHELIEAFHSMLEEVLQADLLLHVIDISNPEYKKQKKVSEDTLKMLKAEQECIIIYNKCDKTELDYPLINNDNIYISSKDENSIKMLVDLIDKKLYKTIHIKLLIPYNQGNIVNELNNRINVLKQEYVDDGCLIEAEGNEDILNQYLKFEVR